MKQLLEIAKCRCKEVLFTYDDERKNNTHHSLKVLIGTWIGLFLSALSIILLCDLINFIIPEQVFLFVAGFFILMQAGSLVALFSGVPYSYCVFILIQYLGIFMCGSAIFGFAFYPTAIFKFPLIDEYLSKVDKFLGHDWFGYTNFLVQYPIFRELLYIGYNSMQISLVIMIFALVISKNAVHLQRFFIAFFLTLAATLIIAWFFPASSVFIYYNVDPNAIHTLRTTSGWDSSHLLAFRESNLHTLPKELHGIGAFPSFHAATGFLLIWGAYPIILIRLLFAIFNILLIVSVPFDGGHYFSDVICGLFIAFLSIPVSYLILPDKINMDNNYSD